MKSWKFKYYIDAFVILLSFAGVRGNALLFKLLGVESQRMVTDFVLLVVLTYILINNERIFKYAKSPYLRPVFFFITIPILNIFNNIIGGVGLGVLFDWLILFVFVILILRGLARDYYKTNQEQCVKWMSKGYIWITLISVLGVFIAFSLTLIFGPDYTPFDAEFLSRHNERTDVSHYWCYTSMLMQELFVVRIPFFQEYGYFTGLYHEPHIFALNSFPGLILLLGMTKKGWQNVLVYLVIILTFLLSGSVTSLLSLTICFLIYFLINSKRKLLPTLFILAITAVSVFIFLQLSGSVYTDFVTDRLANSDSGSRGYSQYALLFALTPHSLLGNNIMSTLAARDMVMYGSMGNADVGFVAFFLNIGFIVTYAINSGRLVIKKDKMAKAVGYASIYCLLHNAKMGMGMYIQLTPLFLVFLQYLALVTYGRRKTVKTNTRERKAVATV